MNCWNVLCDGACILRARRAGFLGRLAEVAHRTDHFGTRERGARLQVVMRLTRGRDPAYGGHACAATANSYSAVASFTCLVVCR